MALPPLIGLYAGSAGLARLTAPVVRAATGLLVSGRSAVRIRSPAPRSNDSPAGRTGVSVYAGTDPLTRRPIRLRATAKTETQARIELGKLLEKARDGRSPEAGLTVAKLLDKYAPIAQWDISTRQTNAGFIRRALKPAIGHLKIRQVNGEIHPLARIRRRRGRRRVKVRPSRTIRGLPAALVEGVLALLLAVHHCPQNPIIPARRANDGSANAPDSPVTEHSGVPFDM